MESQITFFSTPCRPASSSALRMGAGGGGGAAVVVAAAAAAAAAGVGMGASQRVSFVPAWW